MVQQLDRDWLTVRQAADYLQCGTGTIHRLIAEGMVTASQLVPKGRVRISSVSIEKLLEKKRQ